MNKPILKKVQLFFSSFFIFLLHLPFVFAKSKPFESGHVPATKISFTDTLLSKSSLLVNHTNSLYDSLKLSSLGLAQQVFDYAMKGYNYMKEAGKIENDHIISIIDFSKPSNQKRLFIIDIDKCKILFNTYVAHGVKSGTAIANMFSNEPESNKSSLGFYETAETYIGKHGYSMHLKGVEKGINDNAYKRDIVMHAADYVNESLIKSQGYIGRSFGCPAVLPALSKPIIDKIKNGTCLFIYSPDKNYLSHSKIIRSNDQLDLANNN